MVNFTRVTKKQKEQAIEKMMGFNILNDKEYINLSKELYYEGKIFGIKLEEFSLQQLNEIYEIVYLIVKNNKHDEKILYFFFIILDTILDIEKNEVQIFFIPKTIDITLEIYQTINYSKIILPKLMIYFITPKNKKQKIQLLRSIDTKKLNKLIQIMLLQGKNKITNPFLSFIREHGTNKQKGLFALYRSDINQS